MSQFPEVQQANHAAMGPPENDQQILINMSSTAMLSWSHTTRFHKLN